ncbi:23908_t:CDS:2 [Dentiscutata erythropus]|uniref:23908_t:CDS:1 n=1 Tax=Dentiscutata erythropus TaxID=1348616 RepID=A0A9N9E366_9GLOM|nr:23908_t:CDS:2 [Dentiscutata erythropus]
MVSCADITFSYLFYSEQLRFMEFTFNSKYFIRHQVSNLDSSSQEFLESVHKLVDLLQKVINSPYNVVNSYQGLANSFQELMDSSQEVLSDEMHDEMHDEMLHDKMCDETRNGIYDEVHDEVHDKMYETHKGQDLVGINGPLPHINKAIVFTIDDTFPNWSIAEHYVAEYGCQKGFVPIKIRNKTDCSKKLNYDWKVNLSFATSVVHITHFNDNHVEYQLSPDTKIFAPVNHQFSDDCREEICYLAVNGRYDLSTIRSLLSVKYPDQLFLTHDLANVVVEHNVEGSEASQLLKQLYEFRKKDSNWYIELLVDSISNCLRRIFWMNPSQREKWIWFCDIIVQDNMRVEELNNHIKTAINSSSTLLQTVFPQVIQQINKYLTPNLATEQQKQISWNSDLLNLQDVIYNNDFIENTYDVLQSYLLALIKENKYSSVKEENSFQKFVDKKLQFNKSVNLAKKAITLQNSENNNELDTLLKNYIEKKILQREKETKEREMRILRENHSSENVLAIKTDDNQLISINNVANSLNHIGKEAPKKNHIKGAQEDYTPKKKAKPGTSTRLC